MSDPRRLVDRRAINETALKHAVMRVQHVPASQAREVVSAYLEGLTLIELMKNPRLVMLTEMTVGESRMWKPRQKFDRHYMQSSDKYRARKIMNEPDADWITRAEGDEVRVIRIK